MSQDLTRNNFYEDGPVRAFALAAVLWGVVGMLVGVVIAAQLAWPELNLGVPCGRCTPTR